MKYFLQETVVSNKIADPLWNLDFGAKDSWCKLSIWHTLIENEGTKVQDTTWGMRVWKTEGDFQGIAFMITELRTI